MRAIDPNTLPSETLRALMRWNDREYAINTPRGAEVTREELLQDAEWRPDLWEEEPDSRMQRIMQRLGTNLVCAFCCDFPIAQTDIITFWHDGILEDAHTECHASAVADGVVKGG